MNRSACQAACWTKQNFLKMYCPQRLEMTVRFVHNQFYCLQQMKTTAEMQPYLIQINRLVNYFADWMKSKNAVLISCSENGVSNPEEFATFFRGGLEEVFTTITYTVLLRRSFILVSMNEPVIYSETNKQKIVGLWNSISRLGRHIFTDFFTGISHHVYFCRDDSK